MPGGILFGQEICNPQYIGGQNSSPAADYDYFTVPASVNTKGSWNQLVASAAYDICLLDISYNGFFSSSGFGQIAMDIGIGASGSEVVLIPNLVFGCGINDYDFYSNFQIPVQIKAGTRIAMRYQTTSTTLNSFPLGIRVEAYSGEIHRMEGAAGVDAIGVGTLTGSPYATNFTPGNSSTGKGSWTQLVASTSRDYMGLFVSYVPTAGDTTNFPDLNIDIGIGASGSEQVIIPDMMLDQVINGYHRLIPTPIPAGSRLAVRGVGDTAAVAGTSSVVVYGIYQ